jgi:hypothetical protein
LREAEKKDSAPFEAQGKEVWRALRIGERNWMPEVSDGEVVSLA